MGSRPNQQTHPKEDQVSILLVDDKKENLFTLEAVLNCPEYRLVRAKSGGEALLQLLHEDFAVILLDVQMPGMDGFETAALIRQRESTRAIPIIFITAVYGDTRNIGRGYAAGAVDYLIKPFEPAILKSKVAVFAELYRQKQKIQKQSEALFIEREERSKTDAIRRYYDDLLNRLDHSIIWEAETTSMDFQFVSKRALDLLGYPHEAWFTKPGFFLQHVHPDDQSIVQETFERALHTNIDQRCEHRMLRADNAVLWFHTGVQLEKTGSRGKPIFRGLSVDITPFKLEAESMREREAKYRRVVDSNMLGHLFIDLEGGIYDANDCFFKMTGYSSSDVKTKSLKWTELTPPAFKQKDDKAILELKTTGVCAPYEKALTRRDGTHIPVMIGMALMENSRKDCVCFVLDLTERKLAEEEKNRAIRAREELLEIVSHDLKNPLGTVLMNATLLYRKIPINPDPDVVRKHLESIQRSAERMKRLIEDLLDLAKVEAGRLTLEKKEEMIAPLVNEAIEMFQPIAEQKSIIIEKLFEGAENKIFWDHDRVLQVFSNLLGNAIKFTPEKGQIRISIKILENEYCFSIADTGPGIPNNNIPYIFDRYWQAENSRKESLGLGLSIAKGIVEAHRGKIWVESHIGHGSNFYFTIPRDTSKDLRAGAA